MVNIFDIETIFVVLGIEESGEVNAVLATKSYEKALHTCEESLDSSQFIYVWIEELPFL